MHGGEQWIVVGKGAGFRSLEVGTIQRELPSMVSRVGQRPLAAIIIHGSQQLNPIIIDARVAAIGDGVATAIALEHDAIKRMGTAHLIALLQAAVSA